MWAKAQMLLVVGDNAYAALDFLAAAQQLGVTVIARLRLDAALYKPAPAYAGRGRPRKKSQRLPTLAALLTDPDTVWQQQSLAWYAKPLPTFSDAPAVVRQLLWAAYPTF